MSTLPTHLLTRTGNIMAAGGGLIKKPGSHNSGTEVLNSLRENYKAAIEELSSSSSEPEGEGEKTVKLESWTKVVCEEEGEEGRRVLVVPGESPYSEKLVERREDYDITVKLFYLPSTPAPLRCAHTRAALQHVFSELGISSVSLLIVSFPNIHFDADDEDDTTTDEVSSTEDPTSPASTNSIDLPEPDFLQTYRTLENLVIEGLVQKIGLSEFGTRRLTQVLKIARIKPSVDQINVRDCCVVPLPLIKFAKEKGIELLTHDDCYDVLPEENLEGLLAEFGVDGEGVGGRKVKPSWVVKYTAVVREVGVVENKGYIAMGEVL